MRAGTAKEIKFESFDSLFGIPQESVQHITTMVPLEKLYPGTEEKEPVKKRGWKKCLLSSEN